MGIYTVFLCCLNKGVQLLAKLAGGCILFENISTLNEYIYNITDGEHVIVGDTSDITMSSDVTSQELENFKNALASGFYK